MKKRLNIQMEIDVDEYCKRQAKLLGISESGFINVIISQYRQQNEVIDQLPAMLKVMQEKAYMEQLKDVEE